MQVSFEKFVLRRLIFNSERRVCNSVKMCSVSAVLLTTSCEMEIYITCNNKFCMSCVTVYVDFMLMYISPPFILVSLYFHLFPFKISSSSSSPFLDSSFCLFFFSPLLPVPLLALNIFTLRRRKWCKTSGWWENKMFSMQNAGEEEDEENLLYSNPRKMCIRRTYICCMCCKHEYYAYIKVNYQKT